VDKGSVPYWGVDKKKRKECVTFLGRSDGFGGRGRLSKGQGFGNECKTQYLLGTHSKGKIKEKIRSIATIIDAKEREHLQTACPDGRE